MSKATKASVTCKNWSISHPESGSMHESTVKEVYEAATKAASIKSGYKLKGMALNDKGELEEINTSRIDFSKNSTFYLVAEKIPNTTYTIRYHLDGSDKVKEVTKTVAAESYSSTLYSRPFQVEDTKTRLEQGYKWIGWSTKENATEAEYTLGQKVTMTAENPELDLYSVYAPLDQAEFNVVVMYKDGETTTLSKATKASVTCKNWSISHPESGSMHESTVKEVYEAATKAASIKSGYKLKGMALNDKGELEEINTSRIDFSKNSTFYLVAEKVEEVIEPGNKDEDKNNQDTSKDEIKTDVKNDDSNKKQEQGSVKTGDQTALLFNVSLCVLSLLVILSLNRKMKKY